MEKTIIELNEKNYELKYNTRVIENIENVTGKPLVATMVNTNGMMSISDLRQYIALALYTTEGTKVSPKQGSEVFNILLKEKGYVFLAQLVAVTVQRDCPFFFQEG